VPGYLKKVVSKKRDRKFVAITKKNSFEHVNPIFLCGIHEIATSKGMIQEAK
jgi:hypothetical protein